jgi:hypothetical protein
MVGIATLQDCQTFHYKPHWHKLFTTLIDEAVDVGAQLLSKQEPPEGGFCA